MTTQPEALRLADQLGNPPGAPLFVNAAAELRRLHAVNQELLEALRPFAVYGRWGSRDVEVGAARAAIAKAEGKA
jgi:hypothetical protein